MKLVGPVIKSCEAQFQSFEICFLCFSDFKLFKTIPTPSFQFGGKKGSTVTSLVFTHKS